MRRMGTRCPLRTRSRRPALLAAMLALALLAASGPARAQAPETPGPERPPAPSSGPNTGAAAKAAGEPDAGGEPNVGGDIWPEHAMSDEEVAKAARERLGLTREQIILLARLLQDTQRVTADARDGGAAARVRRVRLDPLAADRVPEIAVRAGYVTSVGFFDRTGAPWPIEAVLADERLGATKRDGSAHLVHFAPGARWLSGNASVMLEGLAEPVLLMLGEREGVADFRVDIRLAKAGPNADPLSNAGAAGFHAGSDVLLGLLSGNPPAGAVALDVEGVEARAWRLGGELLLVTRAHLLTPGPRAAERDPSGHWAYRLAGVPYAMVSEGGRELRAAFLERGDIPQQARE